MQKTKLFINGRWEDAISGQTFPSINPATGERLAEVAAGDAADIDRAVAAARAAYEGEWGRVNPADRARLLHKLADLIEAHADELALLDSQDMGKPVHKARGDVDMALADIRFFAGLADKIRGHTIPAPHGYFTYTRREPYGVIGAISPWNFPVYNACLKIAPILAMGNTCVLKPAEQTPLSALEVARLAQEAGFPPGVLNVVTGLGETAGAALARHMDVDKIAFTGSTEVGRLIMEAAARSNLKPVTLELGGKSPNIIFADANLEAAIDGATMSVFSNQGQTCSAGTRVLVQKESAEQVVDGLVARARRVRVGDPLDSRSHVGALVSQAQFERVSRYIERGRREGATLVHGGSRPTDPALARGYFIEPTIFTDVRPGMSIAQEEIFGPVLSVLEFETEAEAIRLANQVTYGLAASIWTRDAGRLQRVAHAVQAGLVWANCIFVLSPAAPVGGYKQSGFGHEYGMEAGLEYTRLKTVWVDMTDQAGDWLS